MVIEIVNAISGLPTNVSNIVMAEGRYGDTSTYTPSYQDNLTGLEPITNTGIMYNIGRDYDYEYRLGTGII